MSEDVGGPIGLSDWVDELLLRFEHWRHRRVVIALSAGMALLALGLGWLYGRTSDRPPVESRIPYVADVTSEPSGQAAVETSGVAGGRPEGRLRGGVPATVGGPEQSEESEAGDGTESYVVHVAGEVRAPGLVAVPADARVNDAIIAAGGPTEDADLHRLNLASPVIDGMQIRVPVNGGDDPKPLVVLPTQVSGAPPVDPAAGPINLNDASAETLDSLPGVGPATAAAIIAWREENGGFRSLEDLLDVPGIGPAKLAAVRDLVVT